MELNKGFVFGSLFMVWLGMVAAVAAVYVNALIGFVYVVFMAFFAWYSTECYIRENRKVAKK